jgi:hypothetical protein
MSIAQREFACGIIGIRFNEMKELLLTQLSSLFSKFRLDSSERVLVREIPAGTQKLLVPFNDLNPTYIFSLLCAIRLDEVENIRNLFNSAPARYHPTTLTSITPLQYFTGEPMEFTVSTPDGLEEAVARLSVLSKDIMRFMDRHKDVRSLHEAMNSPEGSRFDNTINPGRAMRSIILARLVSYEEFRKIVAIQKGAVQNCHEDDRKAFNDLVAYLEQLPRTPS